MTREKSEPDPRQAFASSWQRHLRLSAKIEEVRERPTVRHGIERDLIDLVALHSEFGAENVEGAIGLAIELVLDKFIPDWRTQPFQEFCLTRVNLEFFVSAWPFEAGE